MSDPIRLLSSGGSIERELLSSARDDQSPLDAEERALASLGLSAVVLVAVAASTPGLSGAGAAGASSATASATTVTTTAASFAPAGVPTVGASMLKITGLAFVKWVGVGVVAVAAAAGTYEVAKNHAPETAQTRTLGEPANRSAAAIAVQAQHKVAPAPRVMESFELTSEQAATPELAKTLGRDDHPPESLAAGPVAPASMAPAPGFVGGGGAQGAGELAGELTLLDQARGALAQHNPAASAAALDEYARKYPNGTMREEATVARIETLLLAGQSALAATQAEQFLRQHPSSTNTKRVRLLKKRATAEN